MDPYELAALLMKDPSLAQRLNQPRPEPKPLTSPKPIPGLSRSQDPVAMSNLVHLLAGPEKGPQPILRQNMDGTVQTMGTAAEGEPRPALMETEDGDVTLGGVSGSSNIQARIDVLRGLRGAPDQPFTRRS